jgi:DUF4097 and DUF4098 domain-containing protein YvlB
VKAILSATVSISACTASFIATGCHVSLDHGGDFQPGYGFGERAEREETLDLPISTGQKLRIDIPYGDLVLHAGDALPCVHVKITSHGSTRPEAQSVADAAHLVLETSSDGLIVRVHDTPVAQDIEGGTMRVESRFDLDVALARGVSLEIESKAGEVKAVGPFARAEVRSSHGSIEIADVEGDVAVHSSSGAITLRGVRGERAEAVTSFGEVRIADCDVKSVTVKSSSGDVSVEDVRAERVDASTDYGNAAVKRVRGDLDVHLTSGDVSVEDLDGEKHAVKSEFGEVRVARTHGALDAATSSGDVRVSGFRGRLAAHSGFGRVDVRGVFSALVADTSSGDVDARAEIGSRIDAPWKIRSSFGDVKLGLPADLACELAAKTQSGAVDVDLPIEIAAGERPSETSMRGKLRGGGELVSVQSWSGDVKVYPLH